MTISRSICSLPELASANTAQLLLPSRARTSMRWTIPSGPGAVDTRIRSLSVRCRSTAAVRSIADASLGTFTACTACAGNTPARALKRSASKPMARTKFKRPPLRQKPRPNRPGRPTALTHPRAEEHRRGTLRRFRGFPRACPALPVSPDLALVAHYSSNGQHDLADMRAGLHPGVGGRRLCQGKCAVDDRPDAPGCDQWQHLLLDRT